MSMRYQAAIIKPGFNPLGTQTSIYNLFTWGQNTNGPLGLGNTTNYSSPKQVGTDGWVKVSGGRFHSVAIRTDGTLWAWGYGAYGQLGLGNTTNYSSPKQVGALTNWSEVSCGGYYTLAVKTDGTLWGWGQNSAGQLGFGNTTNYSSPKQVGALTNWKKVSCNRVSTLAVKTNGTAWAWGTNGLGQLGINSATTYFSSPVQIGALTNWLDITSGYAHSIAKKTDGTLWAWGDGSQGQLGLGNTNGYSSPKQIGALTSWLNIGANYQNASGATKTDGTLWMWGQNNAGQLGTGNQTNYSSPKQIGSLTNWLSLGASSNSTFSIKTDGTLWSWGRNTEGQLGINSATTYYSSPKQVGSSTTWYLVGNVMGGYWCIATG